MVQSILTQLTVYNQSRKETDIVYHDIAKKFCLSDTMFWLLYSLKEHGTMYTQKELCKEWSYPPQTINSAIKDLEKRGILKLATVNGNRKNKQIIMTDEGKNLIEKVIMPVMDAEQRAFERMDQQDRIAFLYMTQKHVALLKEEVNKII